VSQSPYELSKQLEGAIKRILAGQDITTLPKTVIQQITELRQALTNAKLDVRDYEFSETRVDQLTYIKAARQRFEQTRKLILAMSEYNVFSTIDVAALSANIEQILSQLM
jgi:hypothetical protein